MTFYTYNGRATQPQVLLQNVHVELVRKIVLINIEVANAQLYYNLLLGNNYMYAFLIYVQYYDFSP